MPYGPENIRTYRGLQDFSRARLGMADQTGADSRNRFMGAITGLQQFNPMQAMQQQAGYINDTMGEEFIRSEGMRRAGLNRRGMLGSDVGGAMARNRFNQALARELAGLSMQGASMDMANRGNVAGMYGQLYGQDNENQNRFFDAMYGSGASWIAGREQSHQASRNNRAALYGAGINAIGNVFSSALSMGRPR